MICPTCRANFDPNTSQSVPFCSPRCRQIDLGRWLDERFSMPHINLEEDEGEEDPPQMPENNDDD